MSTTGQLRPCWPSAWPLWPLWPSAWPLWPCTRPTVCVAVPNLLKWSFACPLVYWFTLVHTGRRLTSPPRGGLVWLGATKSQNPPEAKPAGPAPAASLWSSDKLPTCLTLSFGFGNGHRRRSPLSTLPPPGEFPEKRTIRNFVVSGCHYWSYVDGFSRFSGILTSAVRLPIWQSSAIANMAGFTGLILRFNLNC